MDEYCDHASENCINHVNISNIYVHAKSPGFYILHCIRGYKYIPSSKEQGKGSSLMVLFVDRGHAAMRMKARGRSFQTSSALKVPSNDRDSLSLFNIPLKMSFILPPLLATLDCQNIESICSLYYKYIIPSNAC